MFMFTSNILKFRNKFALCIRLYKCYKITHTHFILSILTRVYNKIDIVCLTIMLRISDKLNYIA